MARHSRNVRIYKRGNTYYGDFHFITRTGQKKEFRESLKTSDKRIAEERADQVIEQIRNAPEVSPNDIPLADAITKYYTDVILPAPSTAEQKRKEHNRYKQLLSFFPEQMLLSDITQTDIAKYIAWLKRRGRTNGTVNRYLCVISALFNKAREDWELNAPSFRPLKYKLKEKAENIKYLKSWDDIENIIFYASPHLHPIIYTAIYTGLRLGNILNLRWQDIDEQQRLINITVKGNKCHTLPIIPKLWDILQALPRDSEYVFTFKGMRIKSIKTAWRALFRRGKMPYINFHTLRHTAATWILKKTHDLKITQQILGHSSISTTLKYAHVLDEQKRKALSEVFI